jgi:signal transduction histidine kinase
MQERRKARSMRSRGGSGEIKLHSRVFSHLSASVLAVLFVFCLGQTELDGLKGLQVDALFRTQWWRSPHPDIALIAYDDESSGRYEGSFKFPAEEISKVFNSLASEQTKAVALLAPVNDKVYTESEIERIGASLRENRNPFIGYIDDESLGRKAPQPLWGIRYIPGFISRDNFSYGADSVSRRVMIEIDGSPTLYSELAWLYNGHKASAPFRYQHQYGKTGNSIQTYINWQGPAGTYKPYSTRAVAEAHYPKGIFKDKIVLVGSVLQSKRWGDHVFTPYSREPFTTSLLEGAANSLSTLMRDNGLYKSPAWLNWLLSLFVGLLTVNLVLFLPPGRGILLVVAEVFLLFVLGWIALFSANCWLDLAHPVIVACVGYYLVIPYRLLDEYRKRWHYQEKSELMGQLEQLKSNFLSLMSHDLKTPIARIQGNAELILNESPSEKQKKCLEAIISTTEDLSQYVETILDFTRVESAQVPVNKTSKDINAIVLEVIESKRFMAAEKNLTIETKLEPIFSFRFDVRLIRRVLSNLVENAIKYSPPDTEITVHSREETNWIKVSVADHGIGIAAEDKERVFNKFFRCENESSKNVKGTGLGLYLVKYFTELHHGAVQLESELGRGSIFTVMLPV